MAQSRAKKGSLRYILVFVLITLALGGGVGAGFILSVSRDLPPVTNLERYPTNVATIIYDDDGEILHKLYLQKRIILKAQQIPKTLVQAFIAIEDSYFYEHWGLRIKSILRASIKNLLAGKVVEGGSTITQQLTRNLFLTSKKTLKRKIKEAILAYQVEKHYTKDQIMLMYLNYIYLGQGSYGVQAAAQTYFGKDAWELNLPECALLAALPKAPEVYNPFKDAQAAIRRRNLVLKRMAELGHITQDMAQKARKAPLGLRQHEQESSIAAYFIEEVRRQIMDRLGYDAVYKEGLKVYTTLDERIQMAANKAFYDGIAMLDQRLEADDQAGYNGKDNLVVQGALVAIEPKTGMVKALIGGRDFDKSEFNRAVQAMRQPGSAIKPFIYATAFSLGYTPIYTLMDEPVSFGSKRKHNYWEPKNYDNKHHGMMTLRDALITSNNVVTARLLNEIGIDLVVDKLRDYGFSGEIKPYLSLALGAFETTLLELTAAYAVFVNQGYYKEPVFITHIEDQSGNILYREKSTSRQVISSQVAFLITDIMQGVVNEGTGWRAKALPFPVAAKTGTASDYTDAWFIGYSSELVAGVWIGRDKKVPLGKMETGSRAAGPIFVDFMRQAHESLHPESFEIPPGMEQVIICGQSLQRATSFCPKAETFKTYFMEGTAPSNVCSLHVPSSEE